MSATVNLPGQATDLVNSNSTAPDFTGVMTIKNFQLLNQPLDSSGRVFGVAHQPSCAPISKSKTTSSSTFLTFQACIRTVRVVSMSTGYELTENCKNSLVLDRLVAIGRVMIIATNRAMQTPRDLGETFWTFHSQNRPPEARLNKIVT